MADPYREAAPEEQKHVPPLWRRALRWTRKEAVIFNHVTMCVGHLFSIATIAGAPAVFAVISVLLLTALLVLQIFHRLPRKADDE